MSNHRLDVKRLLCPLPVIRTQNKVKELVTGETLTIICTDPGVLHDIPAWCRVHGHEVISSERVEKEIIIVIKKGKL